MSIDNLYPFTHWEINKIPQNSKIAIFGSGELGKLLLKELALENREDVIVSFFLDSFKSSTFKEYKVYKYSKDEKYDVDHIVLATMFWPNVIDNISTLNQCVIYKPNHNKFKLSLIDDKNKIIYRRNARTGSLDISTMMLSEGATQSYVDVTDEKYIDYFTFTFVRHPTSRFFSAYRWYVVESLKLDKSKVSAIDLAPVLLSLNSPIEPPSLEHFLDSYMNLDESLRDFHFWGQTKNVDCDLDFIGKLENISADLQTIMEKTGCYKKYNIKHTAPKKLEDYKKIYSPEIISKIENIFSEDYLAFNY